MLGNSNLLLPLVVGCLLARAYHKTIPNVRVLIVTTKSMKNDWQSTAENKVGGCGPLQLYNWGATLPTPDEVMQKFTAGVKTQSKIKRGKTKGGRKKKKRAEHIDNSDSESSDSDSDSDSESDSDSDSADSDSDSNADANSKSKLSSPTKTTSLNTPSTPPVTNNDPPKFIVIFDEAHRLQSMETKVTKSALDLSLHKSCVGCFLLTGTPMKNGKPCNIFPLLRIIKHPLGKNKKKFEIRYCNGRDVHFGQRKVWDAKGSSNLEELHLLIGEWMLRKTKEECLNLKAKRRELRKVEVSASSKNYYKRELLEVARIHKESRKDNGKVGHEAILGALQKLSVASSISKVEATVSLVEKLLWKEDAVVIFSFFKKTAQKIQKQFEDKGLKAELLTGDTKEKDRQEAVRRFQAGQSPVFIGTYGAAGVGITLTKAATIILVDRPWTPGDAVQAEDRVRRIGQEKEVLSIWLQAFPWDDQVDEMIKIKENVSSAVLEIQEGKSSEASTGTSLSINQLVKAAVQQANNLQNSGFVSVQSSSGGGSKLMSQPKLSFGS